MNTKEGKERSRKDRKWNKKIMTVSKQGRRERVEKRPCVAIRANKYIDWWLRIRE